MQHWHRIGRLLPYGIVLATLSACATPDPAIEVRTVKVPVVEQAPCPGERPERPEPLGDLPTDLAKLTATLGAKLAEFAGEGKYRDRAEAIFDRCLAN